MPNLRNAAVVIAGAALRPDATTALTARTCCSTR
jgi:hypothetical protein